MTAEIVDITDHEPNPALIDVLERMLERVRAGEVRSMVFVLGWRDDSTSHGWVKDDRSNRRMLLAETMMATQELATAIQLEDGTSVLQQSPL